MSRPRELLTALARGAELPCWSVDPDLFFAESPTDVARAKTICQHCQVRRQCLTGASERREPWGVWGGELFAKGRVIPTKRGRGRPRKDKPSPALPSRAA